MSRPVLGILCCNRAVGPEAAHLVIHRYVAAAVRHADAAAILVPSLPRLMHADEVAPRLDGLLLTGSPSNVDPARYGNGEAEEADGPLDRDRDAMSADLARACLAAGKPVFGICRGMQELNVMFGGTLRRDMARADAPLPHHAPADAELEAMFDHGHEVMLADGGVLRGAIGREHIRVNSVHFQGVDRLGEGLRIEALADDGTVEAFAAESGAPMLAVQWHPEWHADTDPASRTFFHLLGRALRGQSIRTDNT